MSDEEHDSNSSLSTETDKDNEESDSDSTSDDSSQPESDATGPVTPATTKRRSSRLSPASATNPATPPTPKTPDLQQIQFNREIFDRPPRSFYIPTREEIKVCVKKKSTKPWSKRHKKPNQKGMRKLLGVSTLRACQQCHALKPAGVKGEVDKDLNIHVSQHSLNK